MHRTPAPNPQLPGRGSPLAPRNRLHDYPIHRLGQREWRDSLASTYSELWWKALWPSFREITMGGHSAKTVQTLNRPVSQVQRTPSFTTQFQNVLVPACCL